jgi:RNA 2',3'-cyclic 3'-phosphodiesterase
MAQPFHRLFYALVPPEQQVTAINRIDRLFAHLGSPVRADRRHITLAITGDYRDFPSGLASRLMEIGDACRLFPLSVALDLLFGTETSVSLRPTRKDALVELHRLLAEKALDCDLKLREGWWFYPHMTLRYWNGRRFKKGVDPIIWKADELVLVHSVVGRTEHHILKRWPLDSGISPTIH